MLALLDLDIFLYEIGSAMNSDKTAPLDWNLVTARIRERLDGIIDATEAEAWIGFISGKSNFRTQIATILPYKGNRDPASKPFWHYGIYTYLLNTYPVGIAEGMEADDFIAILGSNLDDVVMCSRDKDLDQVAGWHYSWGSWKQKEKEMYYIDILQGYRNFFTQLLTGDSADNILGLYNIGPKSVAVRNVQKAGWITDMYEIVKKEYKARFGSHWVKFMGENGLLLWLKRTPEDNWLEHFIGYEELSCPDTMDPVLKMLRDNMYSQTQSSAPSLKKSSDTPASGAENKIILAGEGTNETRSEAGIILPFTRQPSSEGT